MGIKEWSLLTLDSSSRVNLLLWLGTESHLKVPECLSESTLRGQLANNFLFVSGLPKDAVRPFPPGISSHTGKYPA